MKVSAALISAKIPPCAITFEDRKAKTSLNKDHSFTIFSEDKGSSTIVLNQSDYHSKITTLLSDDNT